jgi:hypothetical protein
MTVVEQADQAPFNLICFLDTQKRTQTGVHSSLSEQLLQYSSAVNYDERESVRYYVMYIIIAIWS